VTLSSGGRGFDQNGDGIVDDQEGATASAPREILGQSDAQRQTVVDWMKLVRVIAAGMDADGDGTPDLDSSRIYYFGTSFGGGLGPQLLTVEARVRVGVFSYPGGAAGRIDIIRLRPAQRGSFTGAALAARTPSVVNSNGLTSLDGVSVGPPFFNENIPQSTAHNQRCCRRTRHPGGVRALRVGLADRRSGRLRAIRAQEPASRGSAQIGPDPDLQRRSDRTQSQKHGHSPRWRLGGSHHAFSKRPGLFGRSGCAKKPTRVPEQIHLTGDHR